MVRQVRKFSGFLLNKFGLVGGTLACAAGVGFLMQNSETAKSRYSTPVPVEAIPLEPLETEQEQNSDTAPVLEEVKLEIKSMALTSAMTESFAGVTDDLALGAAPTVCDISASAQPELAAMVRLSLKAPCLGNERVTVHHSGMMFTETTAADGSLRVLVPALTKNAFFMLGFANGATASAQVMVEGLDALDRVVVQWRDNPGFELHAREFGADYGGSGHVWANAARSMKVVEDGEGGFLTRVGDPTAPEPLMAEIYTFPSGTTHKTGSITLSLEAEVTADNCGHDVRAQSLEMRRHGGLKSQNLVMSVPDCDAVGDFLVLNNLLEDLKVASN